MNLATDTPATVTVEGNATARTYVGTILPWWWSITVTCSDGTVRHAGTFAQWDEACNWADHGHCCATDHTFTVTAH